MNHTLHYAFLDESGTVGLRNGTHFFIVSILSTESPRSIELVIRSMLKKFGPSLSTGEIKAANFKQSIIFRLLQKIIKLDVEIIAVIVDQRIIFHPPEKPEEIYRKAVTRAIQILIERHPRVEICIDRRYTNERQRYALEKQIREGIESFHQRLVLIRQESSIYRKEIQAADAVVWAFFQKYEHDDSRFHEVISPKVIREELICEKYW